MSSRRPIASIDRADDRTNDATRRTLSFFSPLAYASSALAASVAMTTDVMCATMCDDSFRSSHIVAVPLDAMPANPIATFETSKGTFKAELFLDKTPVTASNFIDLAKTGFYDGLHFHRVIEGFMLVRARCVA